MRKNLILSSNRMFKALTLIAVIFFGISNANAQVSLTATAGVTGPTAYTNLRLAFNAINAGTHGGAITITIGPAGCTETAPAILNQSAAPATYTSVLIKPAAGATPIITGNIGGNGMIYLYGASNVTIDGSNTAGGTSQDMTLRNTTGTGGSSVIRFGSPSLTVGATNNEIKNCKIVMNSNLVGIAISSGSGTTLFGAAEAPNSNNIIRNNAFSNAQTGVYTNGCVAPAANDNGWVITGNSFASMGFGGVRMFRCTNTEITNNTMNNISINGGSDVDGIMLSWEIVDMTISGNKITNVSNTVANGAHGIYLDIVNTSSNVNIFNNYVGNVTCAGSGIIGNNAHGFYMDVGNGVNLHHNSFQLANNSTGAYTNGAACFDPAAAPVGPIPAGAVDMRDNIFSNIQTTGNRYGVYCLSPNTIFSAIDFNDYVATSGNLGYIGGINRTTIPAIQTGFLGNVNSISVTPAFVSPTDLHLQLIPANNPLAVGTPIAAPPITVDIDGVSRSPVTPTIGCHELISKITYTNLAATCSGADVTLNPVTIESPIGVPTLGTQRPRIYFQKGAGPWFSAPGTLVSGSATNGTWSFVISSAAMGGVVSGDVISYFVIAETTTGAIFGNPSNGLAAVDVNTITSPPTTPNTYLVNAVALTGLVTSDDVCFSVAASSASYAYTGTTGSPDEYTLTWSPAGPVPVPVFVSLPAGAFPVTVPAALPSAVYNGTITIRNSTTTCSNTYNITLSVNPNPASISGSTTLCVGTSSVLSSATSGGTWTSTAPSVASIGIATGVVSGLLGGTSTISYTLPTGCSTATNVNVVTPPTPITGTASVCPGLTTTLNNTVAGGTWTSSAPGTAAISSTTGIVTGLVPGTALISYDISGCSGVTRVVTVNPMPDTIHGLPYACEGLTTTLTTSSAPAGTWISGAPSVASIGSMSGLVTGLSSGTAPITYKFTSTGCIRTNTVTIFPAAGPITGGPVICQGLSVTLGNSISGGTWSSSLPGVITVGSTSGIATAYAASGSAVITYTLPTSCSTTTTLNISTAPSTIVGTDEVCTGNTITLTNGTGGGTWTTGSAAIATVGASTGIVTGVMGGTVLISYTTLACNPVSYTVTVNQTPPPITGGINICDGAATTTVFNATPGGVWTISGPASISSAGVITGLVVGATNTVTYTVPNGCFVEAPIIVDTLPAPITGIDSICPGRSDTLHTAATLDTAHVGVWSSSDALVATILAADGVVTGVSHGSVTITYAALSGCYTTKPFTVVNPVPASVTISRTPAEDTICQGIPVTFTAHGVNGGDDPRYQWQLFGINVGVDDTVHSYTPTHGDVIRVFMFNSSDICASPSPVYVDMPINIYPNVSPVINITTTAPTTVSYLGQVATFYANVTSGGGSATFQWFVDNNAIPGATNRTFARTVYDNDTVYCRVNGNPPCETGSLANSNSIIVYGDWLQAGGVSNNVNNLSLFPNPNTGSFTLKGSVAAQPNEEISLKVVNVLGQVVYSDVTTSANGTLDYSIGLNSGIAAGTYMLSVKTESATEVFHFVISK